jgi:hypothetical protein
MKPTTTLLTLAILTPNLVAQSGWSAPVVVPELNTTTSDLGADLSFDGLTMYMAKSLGTVNWDIYVSTRASVTQPWSTPVLEAVLSDPTAVDAGPCLRVDGLEILFDSSRAGGTGGADIWRATRASTGSPWNAPTPVPELNTTDAETSPSLTGDGLTVYFITNRIGGPGQSDIWTATRPNLQSPFGPATPVMELSNAGADRDPSISFDGLTMVSIASVSSSSRTSDLFVARRTNPSAPFSTPVVIAELQSTMFTLAPTLSYNGNEMYFSRLFTSGSYEHMYTKFEGLTAVGYATPTQSRSLAYRDSGAPFQVYVGALSLGTSPGIALGTRTIPLNPDVLFLNSIGGIPGVATGFAGALDANGQAGGAITMPFPQLLGLHLFAGFLTIDLNAPFGVRTISNAIEIEVLQ